MLMNFLLIVHRCLNTRVCIHPINKSLKQTANVWREAEGSGSEMTVGVQPTSHTNRSTSAAQDGLACCLWAT